MTGMEGERDSIRLYRPGASTVGADIVGPKSDLARVEKELLAIEERIQREGSRVTTVLFRIRDVSAIFGGPAFVRFARAYIDRTPTFVRCAVFVERSFVVRTVVDPIALLAPRVTIRTFGTLEPAGGWLKEVDPTFQTPTYPTGQG